MRLLLKKKNKRKAKKVDCIQHHHPDYDKPDYTLPMYRGEHWMITRLDRKFRLSKYKPFSQGFLEALSWFKRLYWQKGVDLEEFFKSQE